MNLKDLPGIGDAIAKRLNDADVETVEQLSKLNIGQLEAFGIRKDDAENILNILKKEFKIDEPVEITIEEQLKKEKESNIAPDSDRIKLTFEPRRTAVISLNLSLSKKQVRLENGREVIREVPAIEGLPTVLTVVAGQTIDVSKKQFSQLKEMGFIETSQEIALKDQVEKGFKPQHPDKVRVDGNMGKNLVTPRQMTQIYTEKLTLAQ